MKKLRCPFCGGKAVKEKKVHTITCKKCGHKICVPDEVKLVEVWNGGLPLRDAAKEEEEMCLDSAVPKQGSTKTKNCFNCGYFGPPLCPTDDVGRCNRVEIILWEEFAIKEAEEKCELWKPKEE